MKLTRYLIGAVGVALAAYGILRILDQSRFTHPSQLIFWLIGALILHDAIIAPLVLVVGFVLDRTVPSRALAFLQAGLVTGGLVSSIGVIMIWRQDKYSSPALALLRQHYRTNLLVLLVLIALVTGVAYVVTVARSNSTKSRPATDH